MVRTPFIDENGIKKGAWSPEEDEKLRSYIQRYGHWNWRELPKCAGLQRCGKSCRLRWINYLRPNVKHGCFTKEEEDLIIKLHRQLGNRWSKIAENLPGRTDNEIKNYWHTHLNKRGQHHKVVTSQEQKRNKIKKSKQSKHHKLSNNNDISGHNLNDHFQILESYPFSPQHSSNSEQSTTISCYNVTTTQENDVSLNASGSMEELLDSSFWTEPFMLDNDKQQNNDDNNLDLSFLDGGILSPTIPSYYEIMDFWCMFTSDVMFEDDYNYPYEKHSVS